jgi:hypothetical protein
MIFSRPAVDTAQRARTTLTQDDDRRPLTAATRGERSLSGVLRSRCTNGQPPVRMSRVPTQSANRSTASMNLRMLDLHEEVENPQPKQWSVP